MKYAAIFLLACVALSAAAPQPQLLWNGWNGLGLGVVPGLVSPGVVATGLGGTVVAGPTVVNGLTGIASAGRIIAPGVPGVVGATII